MASRLYFSMLSRPLHKRSVSARYILNQSAKPELSIFAKPYSAFRKFPTSSSIRTTSTSARLLFAGSGANKYSETPKLAPVPLTVEQYNSLTEVFLDRLTTALEDALENRRDVDVEYSSGVLTLILPPKGTYVINKQPPSRQIWLSSPVSGPKRFDYVEDGQEKKWVYLKNGTVLRELLKEELGVDVDVEAEVDE